MEFILWCSILMDCSCFFPIRLKINEWLWLDDYLTFVGILCMKLYIIFIYLTPFPNVYMCCFNHLHNLKYWFQYLALLNLYLRDPSPKRKASFFLKWFCCYLGIYLSQIGYILSANNGKNMSNNLGNFLTLSSNIGYIWTWTTAHLCWPTSNIWGM